MEKLKIRNFAGIRELDLSLGKINILIGPQATGKSISAKLLYYFKGFTQEIASAVENGLNKRELDSAFLGRFEEYFPPSSWAKGSFSIRYELGDAFIQVSRGEGSRSKLRLDYSDLFHKELAIARLERRKLMEVTAEGKNTRDRFRAMLGVKEHLHDRMNERLGNPAGFGQLFVPAGRSFFAYLQSSIFSFLSSNKAIDPFLTEFGEFYEHMKRWRGMDPRDVRDRQAKSDIQRMIHEILKGRHVHEKGKDFLELTDGRKIAVTSSSSGQQEMLPLAVILGQLSTVTLSHLGSDIFIEEPEAHLFPTAQRRTVELLAAVFRSSRKPLQFIVTTHSPYILTAFNNLMHAGSLARRLPEPALRELYAIVPERQILDPDDVTAYSLAKGTGHSIKCKESGLIDANVIDDVSNELSVQFGHLLDLE